MSVRIAGTSCGDVLVSAPGAYSVLQLSGTGRETGRLSGSGVSC
jgi:hypothetical protein